MVMWWSLVLNLGMIIFSQIKKEKEEKKNPKHDGARRNKWKYLLYDFDENIIWEFEIEKSKVIVLLW